LVVDNDAHAPGDLVSLSMMRMVALGAGMTEEQFQQARLNSAALVKKAKG
jgi:hypothetical protein